MGKSGVITYLFRVLNHCGRKHLTLVRTSLEALALLVKSSQSPSCVALVPLP